MQHIPSPNACPQQVTTDNTVSMGKSNSPKVFLRRYNKNLPPPYH